MDTLIKDLLTYSRLSREEVRIDSVQLDVAVKQALDRLAPETEKTGALISVDVPPGTATGSFDILVHILINLLGNAIKFVDDGDVPEVRVRSEDRGNLVRLWIEDNGIGIDPEQHERIFGIFERLHDTDTYPGTGIGLALVRRGIVLIEGDSGVVSTVGQGSRFWIDLPASEVN